MKHHENKSKPFLIFAAILMVQTLMLMWKFAPNSPGQSLSWGIILLPVAVPAAWIFIAYIIFCIRLIADFTWKYPSDDRDH